MLMTDSAYSPATGNEPTKRAGGQESGAWRGHTNGEGAEAGSLGQWLKTDTWEL